MKPKPDPLYHFRKGGVERRFKRRAEEVLKGRAAPAVVMKCVKCSGLDYTEAKQCTITTCPLWVLNRKYFLCQREV